MGVRTLPPLAAVRVFEAAARLENYSRAAEELAMTQAGVSYQIRLLEERLGVQLFARVGRGVQLTPLGRRIAPRVSEAFAALVEAFAMVRAEDEGVLTVTCSRTFATNWLAANLGRFQVRHPDLAVRLDVSDKIVDLAGGEVDVAIRALPDPGEAVVTHFLMRQVFLPMATPAFLARHPVCEPADLLAVTRISPDNEWWRMWFADAAPEVGFAAPGTGLLFDSQVLDGQAALAGQGVAILNPIMFDLAIRSGQLVPVLPQASCDPRIFWICYPERKRRSAKVRAFRDWLLAALRETAGDDPFGQLAAAGAA